MESYKVKKKDLVGDIKGYHIKIVQLMINNQVRQGNKANIAIFQDNAGAVVEDGGFNYSKSKEGEIFWLDIERWIEKTTLDKLEKLFSQPNPKNVYYRGVPGRGEEIRAALIKLGGKSEAIDRYCNESYFEDPNYIFYIDIENYIWYHEHANIKRFNELYKEANLPKLKKK